MRVMSVLGAFAFALHACAGSSRIGTITLPQADSRDEAALAAAVGWLLRALPAWGLTADVNGEPATAKFLALVMSLAPEPQARAADDTRSFAFIHVAASGPIWATVERASVTLVYGEAERAPITCAVQLKPVSKGWREWRIDRSSCPQRTPSS